MINILISTYNGEPFLSEQIESILAQTCQDWQLVARDDGSTDGTLQILNEFAERYPEKIKIYADKLGNIGVKRSFEELLINCATSDYTMFCDQDDVWLPSKIEIFLQKIHEAETDFGDQTPIVVHGDMRIVDHKLDEIHQSFWRFSHLQPEIIDKNRYFLGLHNTITGCSCLFNRAARKICLPFNPKSYMHDAWLGVCVAANGGKILPISEPTMLYRQHGQNVLGAISVSGFAKQKFRLKLMIQAYRNAHPILFCSVAQFMFYKILFLLKHKIRW